jgi:NADH dehydrogenase
MQKEKHVVIVGGGFGGLEACKAMSKVSGVKVTLIDRRNHHLFKPLLYQVSMAGLSPADIAQHIHES